MLNYGSIHKLEAISYFLRGTFFLSQCFNRVFVIVYRNVQSSVVWACMCLFDVDCSGGLLVFTKMFYFRDAIYAKD